jgi:phosphoribosylanthranilate isomerase
MTKVKICGITSLEDAMMACEYGADLLGFNFYQVSPRYIQPSLCARLVAEIKISFPQVTLVGVFVNMQVSQVNNILQDCGLDLAQFHGDEDSDTILQFPGKAFKAFRGIPSEETIIDFVSNKQTSPPTFLVDSSVAGLYGGSGHAGDWNAAALISKKYSFLLAGGLRSENVTHAINQVSPWGVDTASGVESKPGEKDAEKLKLFIQTVRTAG